MPRADVPRSTLEVCLAIVKALPLAEDGRALLKLRNEHPVPVKVGGIFVGPIEAGVTFGLLGEPIGLRPSEEVVLDITKKLSDGLFETGEQSEKSFTIRLMLSPSGEDQGIVRYRARFENGKFISFSA